MWNKSLTSLIEILVMVTMLTSCTAKILKPSIEDGSSKTKNNSNSTQLTQLTCEENIAGLEESLSSVECAPASIYLDNIFAGACIEDLETLLNYIEGYQLNCAMDCQKYSALIDTHIKITLSKETCRQVQGLFELIEGMGCGDYEALLNNCQIEGCCLDGTKE